MGVDRKAEEERLIAFMIGYQKGKMDDFEGLFAALKQPLLRYLWTFVRNATVAEDLLQETFLQIHRARQTYTPPRPVRPWIYAITRHVALMHLRSGRRRKEVLPSEELPEVPVPPSVVVFSAVTAPVAALLLPLISSVPASTVVGPS